MMSMDDDDDDDSSASNQKQCDKSEMQLLT